MTDRAAPRKCPVCGVVPRRSLRLKGGYPLRQCPKCLLGWWDWRGFDAPGFYDRTYFQSPNNRSGYDDYAGLEPGLRRTARARLKRIDRLCSAFSTPHRRLLDVGCGTGVFLAAARDAGWDVTGLEASAYAASIAADRGLAVCQAAIENAQLEPNEYACITLWDAIEHFQDPLAALRRAAAALRPGGVLALSTGDVTSLCARVSRSAWHLFSLPEHLYFFSPCSLRIMLHRLNCRVVRMRREVNWVSVSYLLERLGKSAGRDTGPRAMPGRNVFLPATLFDVIGVYAVRGRDH